MAMDWAVFAEAVEERPPLLEELLTSTSEEQEDSAASSKDVLARLSEAPSAERENVLVSFLQGEVQAVLRLPSAPAPTVGFFDLGMDSLMAVELRNRLNRALSGAYTAPNTLVFDYPDISALAAHLAGELVDGAAMPAATGTSAPAAPTPASAPATTPTPAPPARDDDDGIAIVGMACRFPGAPDLAAFWQLLEAGADMVTDGRRDAGPWHGVAGDPAGTDDVVRRGAFLDDIDKFDARFFRIPPIEARTMDPRQRLLLETTWHALEDAGVDPGQLKGSRTGVYAGVGNGDYRELAAARGESHGYLGTTMSVTAGRVSFFLGLTGPAVPLDMACASSLVAVHQAAAALRQDEVEMAIVGGVNAILAPEITTFMNEVGMLSRKGRCSAFDAAGDGFVRGEGCGVVVLKRLSDARADGDRIWVVIKGSAVNQNGTSAALTVPNGPAQERVIEDALAGTGIVPAEVDYLEAHGGGSDLGDPIEVQAASAVYGRGRTPERPLLIGSVKTNIGHLECAAGVASLIKAVLAMNEGWIPKQLHFDSPNPHLEWDRLLVRVTSERTDWPRHPGRPPRAGVSSFGISGTNAHVVVEGFAGPDGAPSGPARRNWPLGTAQPVPVLLPGRVAGLSAPAEPSDPRRQRILPLSARSPQALAQLARRYLRWAAGHAGAENGSGPLADPLLADLAWTAGVGRSHFACRAGVVFDDTQSLRAGLDAVAQAEALHGHSGSGESGTPPKVAFAYAGAGSAHAGMGRRLYGREPVVRAVLDRCEEVFRQVRGGASLLDVMFDREGTGGRLRDPEWAQPATYAFQCALTSLWESVGVRPGVAAGDGTGELAAAWAAGVFTLEDGLRFAAARGAAMARPQVRVAAAVPTGQVSGEDQDPSAELDTAFKRVDISPPSISLLSQGTGQVLDLGQVSSGAYWREQARTRASSERRARGLKDLGVNLVLAVDPRRTAAPAALSAWPAAPGTPAGQTFVEAVAAAYEAGLPVSFAGLFAGETRRRISLPGYPFQRERYWIETAS